MKAVRLTAMAATIAALGLTAGCMSAYRLSSTLAVSGQTPQTGGATFAIASVAFVNPTNVPSGDLPSFGEYLLETGYDYQAEERKQPDGTVATAYVPVPHQRHRALVAVEAQKRYPKLFSTEPGAIPLRVTITRVAYESEMGGNPCVSCLTLTIVPMRDQGRTDFMVQTASGDETVDKLLAAPVSFSRMSHSSSSCLIPSGWLPVSGGAEKKLTGDAATEYAGALTIDGCVEAIVQAIRRVDPAAWARIKP